MTMPRKAVGRLSGLLLAVALAACSSTATSASDLKFEAFDVCTQFVKQRLKAPGNATFRDPTANNGDTTITPDSTNTVWVISSSVDSENSFGAKLRSTFTCAVKHQSGANFTLQSLDVQDGGATP